MGYSVPIKSCTVNRQLSDPVIGSEAGLSSCLSSIYFIQFLLEILLVCRRRKYSVITQILAFRAHVMSPSSYRFLRALDCRLLPHQNILQRLYSEVGLESYFHKFNMKTASKYLATTLLKGWFGGLFS